MATSYSHPLTGRYSSREMSFLFSPQKRHSTWRRLWLALAQSQKELGLNITEEQLDEMRQHIDDIDFGMAAEKEKEFRHDVMAHIHTFGNVCPKAMPIIHLGATSCFVTDNADIVIMKEALQLVKRKLVQLMSHLSNAAVQFRDIPTLGFTHYQPAQLTTVGKRICLWLQDFLLDFSNLEYQLDQLPMRGVKGTTGTQLFDGDHEKVKQLSNRVVELMGFSRTVPVSGQTYTRKVDFFILSVLSGIAQSAYKMAGDIRLLANLKEIEEPFEKNQIGSSAMPYKRNPMRCERICSIARYVIGLLDNTAHTHSSQWFERTLDDSAIRRMVIPEAFLGVDVILGIASNVIDGLQVWPHVIRAHVNAELPFMATESILMAAVTAGGDRQLLHEAIREHSMAAGRRVKEEGAANDLLQRIKDDPRFTAIQNSIDELVEPSKFVGRSPEQVDEFIAEHIRPILEENRALLEAQNLDHVEV